MKKMLLLVILSILFSCDKKENPLIGTWKVDSKFYKATCNILEKDDYIKGLVLYYNDDTTIYKYEEGKPKNYFFKNLKEKEDGYVDAISGATQIKTAEETVKLKLISEDTLEVTTYIMNKPLKETWIRN